MKKNFSNREVIFLVVVTCIISVFMGGAIHKPSPETPTSTEKDYYLKEFEKNYQYILDNYYDEVDKHAIVKGAIEGMVNALGDDYSVAISDEDSNNFNIKLTGSYSGVGIEIVNDKDYNIVISDVFEDSPAKKAGLKVLDKIVKVDEVDFVGKKTSELTQYLKNSNQKSFEITVERNGEKMAVTVTREIVQIKSIYSELKETENKKIGYIYVSIFATNTSSQFKEAIAELESKGMDSLIIDVRSNTGGHLTSVVDMLSCLLDSNKIIYQMKTKENVVKFNSKGTVTKEYPIVVLQNKGSASASELLSAALKEEYGATIIGTSSYGKGTVQELVTLSDGTQYKFTTKKWLTPQGNWINGVGVSADIEVELSEEYKNNPIDENDNQLAAAMEYLTKKE